MVSVLIIGYSNVFGGIERFICNLLDNIDRQKIRIDLLVYKQLSEGQMIMLKSKGISIYEVSQIGKKPLSFLRQIFAFYRMHSYHVIHINSSHAVSILYTLPIWFKREVRIIYHSHNMDGSTKFLHRICKGVVKRRSNVKIACSTPAAEYMFGTTQNIEIIKNGIDIQKFSFQQKKRLQLRNKLSLDESNLVIGNAGRFVQEKNHRFLIDIFYSLAEINANIKLILLGDGPLKEEIEDYVKHKGLKEKVIFAGNVDNIEDWYPVFDAFVLPSLYEGFPFVVVEAQANDLPIFLSDKISRETGITEKAVFVSLKAGAEYWAKAIDNKMKTDFKEKIRQDNSFCIKKAGFDFRDTVKRIQELYFDEK